MDGAQWLSSPAYRRQWWLRRTALGEATAVLRTSGAVLFRHWPVLLTLTFSGIAARTFLTWAGVQASKVSATLGLLVMVLLPIASLTALVLMMWVVRDSLPWLSTVKRAKAEAARAGVAPAPRGSMLDHLGSVLIPFLPIYADHGYLKSDVSSYAYAVLHDEVFNNASLFSGGTANVQTRLPFSFTTSMVVTFVCAVVIRWALGKWRIARWLRFPGLLGAYVEVIWIYMLVLLSAAKRNDGLTWVKDRRVVHGLGSGLSGLADRLGPLSHLGHAVLAALGKLLGSVDTVIVVPVAWLTVGAVVYGFEVAAPTRLAIEPLDKARQRLSRMPRLVQRIGAELGESLRDRFGPLVRGLRLVIRTGLRPMLLFCVAFVVVDSAPVWFWEIERWLIGPQSLGEFWMPASEVLSSVNEGLGQTLMVVLLAAAVDRVLRAQEDGALLADLRHAVPLPALPVAAGGAGVPAMAGLPVAATARVAASGPVAAPPVAAAAVAVPPAAAPAPDALATSATAAAPASLATPMRQWTPAQQWTPTPVASDSPRAVAAPAVVAAPGVVAAPEPVASDPPAVVAAPGLEAASVEAPAAAAPGASEPPVGSPWAPPSAVAGGGAADLVMAGSPGDPPTVEQRFVDPPTVEQPYVVPPRSQGGVSRA